MSDNANLNAQFRGQILESASTIETGSRVIASPSDLPILGTDTCLDIKLTVPQALAITLPSLAQLATVVGGRKLRILDANGSWGTYPVTLNASGADKIDGESSITLSQPWGGVEIESRGTYWHVRGVVGLGGMGGGFGPDLLPTPAAADDDEFNGTTLASSWQLFGAALQAGDPSRGATIVGPYVVRVSQTLRTGWLLFQPSLSDASVYFSKLLSTPMTQGAIYCKFSMDANGSVGPDVFGLALCQSALGNIDLDNAVLVSIQRTADCTWTVIAEKKVAGVSTAVYSKTLDSLVQPFDRIQINRNGGSFLFFIGSEAGGMKYLGTIAAAINPDRVAMSGFNTGGPSTIYGLDYIRRVDGVNPTI